MNPMRGVELDRMPFDFGDDAARLAPALRLMGEAGIVMTDLMRHSSDRTFQQLGDPVLQDAIGGQADRGADTFRSRRSYILGVTKVASPGK